MVKLGLGEAKAKSQKLHPDLSYGYSEALKLGLSSTALLGALTECLTGSRAAGTPTNMGCQYPSSFTCRGATLVTGF